MWPKGLELFDLQHASPIYALSCKRRTENHATFKQLAMLAAKEATETAFAPLVREHLEISKWRPFRSCAKRGEAEVRPPFSNSQKLLQGELAGSHASRWKCGLANLRQWLCTAWISAQFIRSVFANSETSTAGTSLDLLRKPPVKSPEGAWPRSAAWPGASA